MSSFFNVTINSSVNWLEKNLLITHNYIYNNVCFYMSANWGNLLKTITCGYRKNILYNIDDTFWDSKTTRIRKLFLTASQGECQAILCNSSVYTLSHQWSIHMLSLMI